MIPSEMTATQIAAMSRVTPDFRNPQGPQVTLLPHPYTVDEITAWPAIAEACRALPGFKWALHCEDQAPTKNRYKIGLKGGACLTATGVFDPVHLKAQWLTIGDVTVSTDSIEYVRPA